MLTLPTMLLVDADGARHRPQRVDHRPGEAARRTHRRRRSQVTGCGFRAAGAVCGGATGFASRPSSRYGTARIRGRRWRSPRSAPGMRPGSVLSDDAPLPRGVRRGRQSRPLCVRCRAGAGVAAAGCSRLTEGTRFERGGQLLCLAALAVVGGLSGVAIQFGPDSAAACAVTLALMTLIAVADFSPRRVARAGRASCPACRRRTAFR